MAFSEELHRELDRCANYVELLKSAKSLHEADECWRNFLTSVARVWNKCENHFGKSPRWRGWSGKYIKLRNADGLLAYIRFARNALEHTVAVPIKHELESVAFGAGPAGSVHIRGIRLGPKGIEVDADGLVSLTFKPWELVLLPVFASGKTYPIPEAHLGSPLSSPNPIEVAEAGLAFYKRVVADTEIFLCR